MVPGCAGAGDYRPLNQKFPELCTRLILVYAFEPMSPWRLFRWCRMFTCFWQQVHTANSLLRAFRLPAQAHRYWCQVYWGL